MTTLDEMLALERQVWDALVAGDAAADAALICRDFIGVYKTGWADRADHCGQLRDGPTVSGYELHQPQVMELPGDTVLLTYLARYTRAGTPQIEEAMYVSSIWQCLEGRWLNIFSQDTDAV